MPTDVVMPQMGESIAEGTIVRWMKKVGDPVERDEPLFEISTDKVDAEIPSPAAGIIAEIRAKEGQTVEVNTVVAVIGEAGTRPAPPPAAPAAVHVAPPTTPVGTRTRGSTAGPSTRTRRERGSSTSTRTPTAVSTHVRSRTSCSRSAPRRAATWST